MPKTVHKEMLKKEDCNHCFHLPTREYNQEWATVPFEDGGPNRRCCRCGFYESDIFHGSFSPVYDKETSLKPTWTTTTVTWPPNGITVTGNTICSPGTNYMIGGNPPKPSNKIDDDEGDACNCQRCRG